LAEVAAQPHHRDVDAEGPSLPVFSEHPAIEGDRAESLQAAQMVLQLHRRAPVRAVLDSGLGPRRPLFG
jgi:hypothetical protein